MNTVGDAFYTYQGRFGIQVIYLLVLSETFSEPIGEYKAHQGWRRPWLQTNNINLKLLWLPGGVSRNV